MATGEVHEGEGRAFRGWSWLVYALVGDDSNDNGRDNSNNERNCDDGHACDIGGDGAYDDTILTVNNFPSNLHGGPSLIQQEYKGRKYHIESTTGIKLSGCHSPHAPTAWTHDS